MTTEGSGYIRICELAKGGMGTVDLAVRREGRFRRLYAVKRLRETYREDADFREMFLDEARIAGYLRHPHIVSVLDVGEDESGPYLVMDFVDGVSVHKLIRRAREVGRGIPLSVALRIVAQAAEGLHAAHELRDGQGQPLQLVHRDITPQNILLGFDGFARVTDFGIAKALGRSTQTATGVLKGKFGYMAPEQLRFEEPDRRSDIFSLGVVLFELLTQERLYQNSDGMDGARRILNEPPPDLGESRDDAPPELVALMFRMLAKDPAHRPKNALDVARTLESLLADVESDGGIRVEAADYLDELFADEKQQSKQRMADKLTESGVTDLSELMPKATKRSWRVAALLAATFVLGALGWGAMQVMSDSPPSQEVPAPVAAPPPAQAEQSPPPPEETNEAPEPVVEEPSPAEMRTRRPRRRGSTMRSATKRPDFFVPFED